MDSLHARFAERGIARGALEVEVMAMGTEGFVDPAGGDVGGVHPLTFAFFPGRGDDVRFVARPFRGASPDSSLKGGEPEANGLVLRFDDPEICLLVGATLVITELVGCGIGQVVDPICHSEFRGRRGARRRCDSSVW